MLRKITIGLVTVVIFATLLTAWLFKPIAATHPVLAKADLPKLIPIREFYASSEARWRFQLSPDGQKLSWLESKWFKPALWVKTLNGTSGKPIHTSDRVRWYRWSADSRYLLYQADRDGWENDVIVSIDTNSPDPKPKSYDFGKGVKSFLVQVPNRAKDTIVIAHNKRDRSRFDLYRLNLTTGKTVSLGQSQQQRIHWHLSHKGNVFARTRYYDKDKWAFELHNDGVWKSLIRGGFEDEFKPLDTWDNTDKFYAISNMGRDKTILVSFDIKTQQETIIKASEAVDVSGVLMDRVSGKPQAFITHPGHQKIEFMDKKLAALVSNLNAPKDATLNFQTITNDAAKILLSVEEANAGFEVKMVDRASGAATKIATPTVAQFRDRLSQVEPVFISARDGLKIPAYLSQPKGVEGPAPMVILIHGGPIARTFGGWNTFRQFLNNRGYAVLDVNYRGSAGYGRAFREAAVNAVSREMDNDISDARAWAVEQGIADPEKVAVLGGSFGGLKVLTALTRNPDLYAAGVNINGISDLVSMRDEIPPYWRGWDFWYDKYLGDPKNPVEKEIIGIVLP